jgi:hypothetical protein
MGRVFERSGSLRVLLSAAALLIAAVVVVSRIRDDASDGGANLDRLNLEAAVAVAADSDGGLWILTDDALLHATDGRVDPTRSFPAGGSRLAAGPGGETVMSASSTVVALPADGSQTTGLTIPGGMLVNDLAVADDGAVLVSYSDADHSNGRIAGFKPGTGVRHVLGAAGIAPQAAIQVDEPLAAISSMAALPDGRVAFVTVDNSALRLLDNGDVTTIETTPADPSRALRLTGTAPGGRLLAIAWGHETHFQIKVIDVDTGQAETVADLNGVDDGVVDATAAGDDLVYLAEGRLWRSAGVLE